MRPMKKGGDLGALMPQVGPDGVGLPAEAGPLEGRQASRRKSASLTIRARLWRFLKFPEEEDEWQYA